MKRALLPILILVAAVVVGAIVWLNKSSTASTLTPEAQSAAQASASGRLGDKDALLSPDEARAQAERAGAASVAAHADGPALDGQILAPPDCTADDSVEVFGISREADIDELFAAIGPVGAGDDALGDVELSRLVIARAKMDAGGRFHLALPAGTHKTHILFAGRSWFLRESFAVQLKDVAAGGVLLQAECGGWVSGRIDLPAAAASRAHELDGQVAVLRPALGGFNPGQRGGFRRVERRASVNGLEFEVRALDPSVDYSLEMVPKTMAAVKVDVPDVVRGRATPVSLSMANGGTVTGRALGPNGEAIAGARVEARVKGQFFGFDDRVVRSSESRADGSFTLAAVSPGSVEIDADSKDHVASDPKKLDIVDGGSASGIDLVLGAGETIAGVVTWKDGGPAVGATVTANAERGGRNNFGPGGGRGPGRGEDPVATTDEQGRFVLKGLSGSTFTANAEELSATDAAASAQSSAATKRKLSWRARATGVKAGATDVALVLEAPIVVKGTVLSATDGTPVKHFNVRAQPGGRNNGGPGFGGPGGGQGGGRNSEDVDDEHGEFVLGGLREGTWRLEIAADGYAPSDAIELTLPAKTGDPAPVFHLVKAALVNGTVTSPSGAPVANATVTEASSGGAPWMRGGGNPAVDVHARTDANGRFRIDGMKGGRMTLVAESKEWARSNEVGVDFVAGTASADIVLVMHTGGRITGEVFEDGRPAVGRSINATQTATFTNLSSRTDGRGAFAIDHVEAGNWRIVALPSADEMASAAGDGGGRGNMFSRMKSASTDVVDGQESHVVIGAPPADPVKVSGKVTQGGEGVSGARVMFLASGQPMGPGTKNTQTGTDGTYSIQLDTAGDYSVTVQAQGGGGGNRGGGGGLNMVEFVETIRDSSGRGGADVVLDFALPSARISGLVRTPDGDPAVRVRVLLEPATQTVGGSMMGAGFSDVSTDGDGAFDIQTLRAGKYVLTIGGSRNAFRGGGGPPGGADSLYGKKTIDVQLAESEWRRDIDVRLEKAANVAVDVVDDGGNKVANANVFARDASGRTVDRLSTVRTDAEGHATYSGLSAGRYTFSARKGSQVSGESAAVQVSDGGSSSAHVTLANGTLLYVTTIGVDGTAQRAQVSVLDEAGHDVAGMMTLQDLTQRFQSGGPGSNEQKVGPLSTGKYRVHATTTDGHSADKTVTLSGEAENRITLTMSS